MKTKYSNSSKLLIFFSVFLTASCSATSNNVEIEKEPQILRSSTGISNALVKSNPANNIEHLTANQQKIQNKMESYQDDWLSLSYVKNSDNPVNDRGQTDKQSKRGYVCANTSVKLSDNVSELPLFAEPPNNIYPGSIIKGNTTGPGSYGVFSGPRNSGVIVFSSPWNNNQDDTADKTVLGSENLPTLDFSSYQNALAKYLNMPRDTPASISYSIQTVYSAEHLGFLMSANVAAEEFDVKAKFSIDQKSNSQYALVTVNQHFFRATLNRPDFGAKVFSPDINDAETKSIIRQMSETNPPLYVSYMDYGRSLYALFSSTDLNLDLKASLEAGYRGGVNVDGSVNVEYQNQLKSTNANGYIIGGSAQSAASTLAEIMPSKDGDGLSAINAIRKWVEEGGTTSPKNPPAAQAYGLAMLSDGSKTHANKTTAFTESNCKVGVCPSGTFWAQKEGTTWIEFTPEPQPDIYPAAGKIGDVLQIADGGFYTYEWGRCLRLNWQNIQLECISNQRPDFVPGESPPGVWKWKDYVEIDPATNKEISRKKHTVFFDAACGDYNASQDNISARRVGENEIPIALESETAAQGIEPTRAKGTPKKPELKWK